MALAIILEPLKFSIEMCISGLYLSNFHHLLTEEFWASHKKKVMAGKDLLDMRVFGECLLQRKEKVYPYLNHCINQPPNLLSKNIRISNTIY